MKTDIQQFRRELERKKGERCGIEKMLDATKEKIEILERKGIYIEDANRILASVAKMTQDELCFHIETLVSLALEAVFPDPYQFYLTFELRRGKSEADLTFSRKGLKENIDPMSASGGGVVDVAAFALRVSLYSLGRPKTRNVLLLDEPFRFLSADLQSKASAMLKEISEKLNLQFIMITHEENLTSAADKIFEVGMTRGISIVETEIKEEGLKDEDR